MTSSYYDLQKVAKAIAPFISPEQSIIEIGVGTGMLLEKLLEIDPNYQLTGMDRNPRNAGSGSRALGPSG